MLTNISGIPTQGKDHLHHLVAEWQIISDISFADLLLVLFDEGKQEYVVVSACRPATSPTVYSDDIVGHTVDASLRSVISLTHHDGGVRQVRSGKIYHTIYPVLYDESIVGVLDVARSAALMSPVESHDYIECGSFLCSMVASGDFPISSSTPHYRHGVPRFSDGFLHLDSHGDVIYASPNAHSLIHRLGISEKLIDAHLPRLFEKLLREKTINEMDEYLPVILSGRQARISEVEHNGVNIAFRSIPLVLNGKRFGAILLCRDVSEIRRREQEVITKDATIREINHRVKNNLQTVSALLRMQARRANNESVRKELGEAQRRVSAIALVHQILSQEVNEHANFDVIINPLLSTVTDIATTMSPVHMSIEGTYGYMNANQITALAVVLNELVANAIEHGAYTDRDLHLHVVGERKDELLTIHVIDDGKGIGNGPHTGLGTSIVQTMVIGELGGTIQWNNRSVGGTDVVLELNLSAGT